MTEESIFNAALEKSSTTERQAFLDTACGGDPALRARLQALLEADARQRGFLDGTAPSPFPLSPQGRGGEVRENATGAYVPSTPLGTVVAGRYKLMEKIGEGGFGLVYVAEQQEPVRRRVALKIIKPGMDSAQIIARFESERQALAMMDHQNIAKVHDAGATANGRPFFVMELVHGVPITDYCDANKLTPRQRLELFVPICHAIQHAHQKGIIHRDIKPSNILVTMYDDKPVPKVIDFGVAKAIEQRLTERTIYTQFGTLVGTFEYMSPEQAEMNAFGVDTRSDIYSLGVLLYELLTGSTPLEKARLRTAGFDEIRRIIKEEEPPRPSARLSTSQTLAMVAAARHTEPAKLAKLVRGELDWVVMKCLEKDRTRRYETANGLARDIERYLKDEPVQACPPSAGYRFRKFARRHKIVLAAAAMVFSFIVLLGVVAGWFVRDRAARHADTAGRADNFLHEAARLRDQKSWAEARAAAQRADLLLGESDDHTHLRQRLREVVRDLNMVDRLERIREDQSEIKDGWWDHASADPAYEAAFRDYGIDVMTLDAAVAAERVRASAISEQLVPALDDWHWVTNRENTGRREPIRAVVGLADPDRWRARFRDASGQRNRLVLEELAGRPEVAVLPPSSVVLLGRFLVAVQAAPKAIEVLVAAQRRHPADFWLNMTLAHILRWRIQPPRPLDAAAYCRAALAIRPKSTGVQAGLASCFYSRAHADEAIAHYHRLFELEPDNPKPYFHIGQTLALKGAWREAIESYQKCLRRNASPNLAADVHHALAVAYRALDETDKEAVELDEVIACYKRSVEINPAHAPAHTALGDALEKQGKLAEALVAFRQALTLKPNDAWAHINVGRVLGFQHKWEETVALARRAQTLDPKNAAAHSDLGWALTSLGKADEAIPALRQALALYPEFANAHINLGRALQKQGKLEDALASFWRALEYEPKHFYARQDVFNFIRYQEDRDRTIAFFRKAIEANAQSAPAHYYLGNAFWYQGNVNQSLEPFKTAVKLDPNEADYHYSLANSLRTLNRLDEAIQSYAKAIALNSRHAEMRVELGVALKRKGRLEEAISSWKKAIEIDPKFVRARTNLAWHLATAADPKLRNSQAAVLHAQKAVELASETPNHWSNLGVALLRAGEPQAAVEALEKADRMWKGGDLQHRYFLTMAYWQTGEKEKARQAYEQGLQWMDNHQPKNEEFRRFRAEAAELLGIAATSHPVPKTK